MSDGLVVVAITSFVTVAGVVWRRRRDWRRFERGAEQLWRFAERAIDFREATDSDHILLAQLEAAGAQHIELERYFRRLGDLIQITSGAAEYPVPIRLFVSPDGTIAAYLIAPNGSIGFESYVGGDEIVSKLGGRQYFALPRYVQLESYDAAMPIADMLAKHRARLPAGASLLHMDSLADVRDQFKRSHARMREWRATCDPDDLLSGDLRAIMGEDGFRQFGDRYMARFRKRRKVPRAVVRPKA